MVINKKYPAKFIFSYKTIFFSKLKNIISQSVGAVEYIDCFFAEG